MSFIFPNLAQRKNGKNLDLHQSRKTKSAARIQNELFRKRFFEMEDFFKILFVMHIKVLQCQEWMDYCMRFLTRAFATKDAFVNLVVQHTLLVGQWIFEKYNSAEPAVFLDTSQTEDSLSGKRKKDLFNSWPINAPHLANWIEVKNSILIIKLDSYKILTW